MRQRVLVCGGRDYQDGQAMYRVLDAAHNANPIEVLIHGAARGADTIADDWARSRLVRIESYKITKADWALHGKAAGPIRNRAMLVGGKPDLVIAFPTKRSKGTFDMIRQANAAGVPVTEIKL